MTEEPDQQEQEADELGRSEQAPADVESVNLEGVDLVAAGVEEASPPDLFAEGGVVTAHVPVA